MQEHTAIVPVAQEKKSEDYIDRVFGPNGYLAKQKPGYVPRSAQIEFARAVDKALRENTPLLAQAPCGTGKALAYLVPAIYHAVAKGKRVIVATATNSLLDQLSKGPDCELAMLQKALPTKFRFATLKGKANYLCHKKYEAFEPSLQLDHHKEPARRLALWAEHTTTGDKGEAPETPLWYKVSCTPDDCTKPSCLNSKKTDELRNGAPYCLSEEAKDRAKDVHVIVTNIHYLITSLRFQETALPEVDIYIIDEGHELPDITREFWGGEQREKDFSDIIAYAYMMERSKQLAVGTASTIKEQASAFFKYLSDSTLDPVKTAMRKPQDFEREKLLNEIDYDVEPLKTALKACAKVAKVVLDERDAKGSSEIGADEESQKFNNHFKKIWEMLDSVTSTEGEMARWVKVKGDDVCVKYAPIEVGKILRDNLFRKHPATVLASATLATGGDFTFIKREVGLGYEIKLDGGRTAKAMEINVSSPFDFKNQCLFLVPKDAKDPSEYVAWKEHVFKTLHRVVELCDGRTLGLFTSRKMLEEAAEWLRRITKGRTILVQGDFAPREIAKRFKEEKESVLLGTRSFWTGLDVPGESLSAVVMDKLPIPQQDPLMQALKNKVGGAYWDNYLFPKASITFQQGCGRVIRSVTDVGVIVLCDPRLDTKRYGHHFRRSLPAMETGNDIEKIPEFLIASKAYLSVMKPKK